MGLEHGDRHRRASHTTGRISSFKIGNAERSGQFGVPKTTNTTTSRAIDIDATKISGISDNIENILRENGEKDHSHNSENKERNIALAQTASFGIMARSLRGDVQRFLQPALQERTDNGSIHTLDLEIELDSGKKISVAPLAESVATHELEQLGLSNKIKLISSDREGRTHDQGSPHHAIVFGYQWIQEAMEPVEALLLNQQLERVIAQTDHAREDLMGRNLGLAINLSKSYGVNDGDLDVIIPIAKGGLTKAAYTYDWMTGFSYSTYAHELIRREFSHKSYGIQRARRDEELITPDLEIKTAVIPVKDAIGDLMKNGDPVSNEAVVRVLKLRGVDEIDVEKVGAVRDFLFRTKGVVRFDARANNSDEGDITVGEITPDTRDLFAEVETRVDLDRALALLPKEVRTIVEARNLLGVPRDEVAKILGMAPEAVSSIASRGARKMRAALELKDNTVAVPDPKDQEREEILAYVNTLPYTDLFGRVISKPPEGMNPEYLFPMRIAPILANEDNFDLVLYAYRRYVQGRTPEQISEEFSIGLKILTTKLNYIKKKIGDHMAHGTTDKAELSETNALSYGN